MSYFQQQNASLVFYDAANEPKELINFENYFVNQSNLPQATFAYHISSVLSKLFDGSPECGMNVIIYLRIVAELLRKPQIHSALHFGNWSPLDEALAETLPIFNAENSLYCYVPHRPVGNFVNVNFVSAEVNGGGGILSPKINFRLCFLRSSSYRRRKFFSRRKILENVTSSLPNRFCKTS